jgi:hypothetical protein
VSVIVPIDDFFHAVEERQTKRPSPYARRAEKEDETVDECTRKSCHEPRIDGKRLCRKHYDAVMVGRRAGAASRVGKRVGETEQGRNGGVFDDAPTVEDCMDATHMCSRLDRMKCEREGKLRAALDRLFATSFGGDDR